MGVDTVDGSLGGAIHVHQLDTLRPILDQLLPKSFAGNNYSLQGWVVVKRDDGKDAWSTVDDVDTKGPYSLPNITEHEFLPSSNESCTAGKGPENVDDKGVEGISKGRENSCTLVVTVWLRVLDQVCDGTVLDHDTLRFAGASTCESIRSVSNGIRNERKPRRTRRMQDLPECDQESPSCCRLT